MVNVMLYTKSLVPHNHGVILAKPEYHLEPEGKSISKIQVYVAKHAWSLDNAVGFDS